MRVESRSKNLRFWFWGKHCTERVSTTVEWEWSGAPHLMTSTLSFFTCGRPRAALVMPNTRQHGPATDDDDFLLDAQSPAEQNLAGTASRNQRGLLRLTLQDTWIARVLVAPPTPPECVKRSGHILGSFLPTCTRSHVMKRCFPP